MSYYTFTPRQVYPTAGIGALGGIDFNGEAVWADWSSCNAVYQASVAAGTQFVPPASCKRSVDAMRAALGELGYGKLGMGIQWGSADQGAWKKWAADVGVAGTNGMPTKDGLKVMDAQLAKGTVTGDEKVVEYVKVDGDNYVDKSVFDKDGTATAGIDWSTWGLVALGAAGVAAVAIVASKKKGARRQPPRARPGMSGPPSMAASRM
jgi:hypothetical protein